MRQYSYNTPSRSSPKSWRLSLPSRLSRLRLISTLVTILFFLMIGSAIGTGFLFAWYGRDLPRPDYVQRSKGFSTIIYDRNGQSLYDIYSEQNRVPIELGEIPIYLRQATIAIEDKNFYKHQGFSQRGMLRALFNIIFRQRLQGGSTLTQQLVKNVLLTSERTIPRKIKEFILAVRIEQKYTKDEILQMYLNEASYGGATAGIEKAAQYYFDKHARDLTLVEAIILAGLPAAPTRYSPFNPEDPQAYIWRAEQVARRMKEDGFINHEQEAQIKRQLPDVKFVARATDIKAPHFVFYVRQQLIDRFGEQMVETGGLRVTTTLDWQLEQQAEKIVKEEIDKLKGLKVGNGAAIVINPQTGEILSMVGSKEYTASESGAFNVVTQALRQPGSAIKPVTYAAAFKKGFTAATVFFDVETHFPGGLSKPDYIPKNYDGRFRGPLQLRYALGNSINLIAVKLQALVSVKEMLKLAYQIGIGSLQPTDEMANRVGLSVVLGGGDVRLIDLTSAYGVFANQGIRHEPYAVAQVTDRVGKVLWEYRPPKGKQITSPEVAFLISSILSDNEARRDVFGPNSSLFIPERTVAVKTGTTDDVRDNWTIGYTPQVAVGVWVGNNDNTFMNRQLVSGVTGAAPIWNRIMREVLKGREDEPFSPGENIILMEIDAFAGGLPKTGQPTRWEYFIKGTEPTDIAPIYKQIKLSKSQPGKLANKIEIASGNFEEKEFFVVSQSDPISTDGKNRWQEAINAWVKNQADPRYQLPEETSTSQENEVVVSIIKPTDHEQIDTNEVSLEAKAASVVEIERLEVEIDGAVKLSVNDSRLKELFNLPDGKHEIKVKAIDKKGNVGERLVRIGVKVPWDYTPTPIPIPIPIPSPTAVSPTVSPTP